MAALNFPDPNVTTTYTNPDTGITYEWSNNTWKAIRSAQTAPELFVDYDGDNMTGDLTFNTDKIVLGATFGTGTFAGNIEIGGDVSSPTAGGVEITSTGTVIANRIGNPNPTSYADCFVGRYNGVDTSEIKADGSATFDGVLTGNQRVVINQAGGKTGPAHTLLNYAGDGTTVTASFTADGSAAFSSSITAQNTILANRTGSTQTAFQATLSGATKVNITAGGAASFGTQNLSSDGGAGTAITGDGRMSLQFPSGGGAGVEMFSLYSGTSKTISMLSGGSATFSSSIGIGTISPSYLLDAQYQPNRYFQLRYAKPYAKYDDNAMIDAFTFQNLGTTESGHGSKIEFIVGTSVSSNSSSIQAQREGAAGNTNLVFGTNSSEQMRIDSSGRLLVGLNSDLSGGTTSTGIQLATTGGGFIGLAKNDTSVAAGNGLGGLRIYANDPSSYNDVGIIQCVADGTHNLDDYPTRWEFHTTADGASSPSERVRITNDGRLLVGTDTSLSSNAYVQSYRSSGNNYTYIKSDALSDGQYCIFQAGGSSSSGNNRFAYIGIYKHSGITNAAPFFFLESENGTNRYYWTDNSNNLRTTSSTANIGTTNGTVVGTQTSDERVKNVGDSVNYGLAEVLQLQPKQYALKSEPDVNKLGFIAQEVESIIPEAVFDTQEELEGHQEGDRTKLGMEYVQLIPVLVNAIKEQQTTIADLQSRLAALEAG